MDRRRFLGLLGAGAAAIAVPERTRSYFFGPWAPGQPKLVECRLMYRLLPAPNEITPEMVAHLGPSDLRALADQVDKHILDLESAAGLAGMEGAGFAIQTMHEGSGFVPTIWNERVLEGLLPNPNYRYSEIPPSVVYPRWENGRLVEVRTRLENDRRSG